MRKNLLKFFVSIVFFSLTNSYALSFNNFKYYEVCAGEYKSSGNYDKYDNCERDRLEAVREGRSLSIDCSKGLFYYYYCVKK